MAPDEIQYSFIEQVFLHFLKQYQMIENTAMKYAQCVKEMMDRAVARGWIAANLFTIFKCRYKDPQHDWLTMQEMETLRSLQFEKTKLNVIRDIFVFENFTRLAYNDIRNIVPTDIIIGVDGKKWISKNRQKTGARQSNEGRIYGITFIDHQNRCVFNGSSLGRNYSAQAIQERFVASREIAKKETLIVGQKIKSSIKIILVLEKIFYQAKTNMIFLANTSVLG